MNIKLNSLHLKNFKGIKDFKLIADGKNVSVYGNNATGKTTLIDSFLWLLFDKDSNDKSDTNFTIKPQDEQGQDINNLQTSVEAELLVDGQPLKLKKIREEKWVKRHGETEKTFDGHIKSYWFNEVPLKATPYKAKVDGLIDENIFKMITNPLYFNTKLSWEERREILLQISGDMTNDEVIASDEKLSKLTELLSGRTIDEYKSVLADQLKGYKKERDNIPPRIDELTRSLPQMEPDYAETERELECHKDELATVEFLMTNASNKANELNKKHQELYSLKNQLEKVKEKIKTECGTDRTKLLEKKSELENGKFVLQSGIRELELDIQQTRTHLESNARTRQRLLDEWRSLSDKNLEILTEEMEVATIASHCPVCEQKIPEEAIATEFESFKSKFDKSKKDRLAENMALLEKNKQSGLELRTDTEKVQAELKSAEKELQDKEFKLENLKISINALDVGLSKPIPEPDYTTNHEYTMLVINIEKLQIELDKPIEDKSLELLQKKANIQIEIDKCNSILNGKLEIEKKKTRIEELKADEKRVSTLIAELEGHKFLLERFSTAKVNLLEDSINIQFNHVKFKLFEENVTNEGIKETCIALVNTNGSYIKFEDANSAGKINSGIDVINSLCKFYDVTAPIFTDNAESVTDLASTESQVIRLIKPEIRNEEDRKKYSQLVVEVQ